MERDYSKIGFGLNEMVGFLMRSHFEDAARFVMQDSEAPATPLFIYTDNKNTMTLPALASLAKGDPAPIVAAAATNPDAVRTLVAFGHASGGDLYDAMLSSGKPAAVKDTFEAIAQVFGPAADRYVMDGLLPHLRQRRSVSFADIKTVAETGRAMPLSDVQKTSFEQTLKKIALGKLNEGFSREGRIFTTHVKDAAEMIQAFDDVRASFGEEQGNRLIASAMKSILPQQLGSYEHQASALSAIAFEQAEKSGLTKKEIGDILSSQTLFYNMLKSQNEKSVTFFQDKLRECVGDGVADEWLQKQLTTRMEILPADLHADLYMPIQNLCNDFPSGAEGKDAARLVRDHIVNRLTLPEGELRTAVEAARPAIRRYLDGDTASERDDRALSRLAEDPAPVVYGPTILAYADADNMPFVIAEQARLGGQEPVQHQAAIVSDLTSPLPGYYGRTPMHTRWAERDRNVRGREFVEKLSPLVSVLDRTFGPDVGVEIVGRLLSAPDEEGRNVFETMLADRKEEAVEEYSAIVRGLAERLGEPLFERYMEQAVLPNVPPTLGGGKRSERIANKYLPAEIFKP